MKKHIPVIKIDKNTKLTDAVCKAMNPKHLVGEKSHLYESIKTSLGEDDIGIKTGEASFVNAEWKNQINVMLG